MGRPGETHEKTVALHAGLDMTMTFGQAGAAETAGAYSADGVYGGIGCFSNEAIKQADKPVQGAAEAVAEAAQLGPEAASPSRSLGHQSGLGLAGLSCGELFRWSA